MNALYLIATYAAVIVFGFSAATFAVASAKIALHAKDEGDVWNAASALLMGVVCLLLGLMVWKLV